MAYKIRTKVGLTDTIILRDLGNKKIVPPFPSSNINDYYDLEKEFGLPEILKSTDLLNAIENGSLLNQVEIDPENLQSAWVSATLSDITPLGDLMKEIDKASRSINGFIDGLVEVVNLIVSIVEVAEKIVTAVEDTQTAIIRGVINGLNIIKDQILATIKDVLDFGLYILPHAESFPWRAAIRNELLNPGITSKSALPQDRYQKIPNLENPNDYHYERVRRADRIKSTDYNQFVKDIVDSFNDSKDLLRPTFEANDKVSGVTIAISADRVSIFVLLYMALSVLINGKEATSAKMGTWGKMLKIALGESETLARTENQQSKDELTVILERFDNWANKQYSDFDNLGTSLVDMIVDLLSIINPEKEDITSGIPVITGVSVSGDSDKYAIFQEDIENQVIIPNAIVLPDVGVVQSSDINFANSVSFSITTNGQGTLFVKRNNEIYCVGSNKERFDIVIPLDAIGEGRIIGEEIIEQESNNQLNIKYNGIWGNNSGIQFSIPTKIEIVLAKVEGKLSNVDLSTIFNQAYDNSESILRINEKMGFVVYVPRFERRSQTSRDIDDNFSQLVSIQIEPSTSAMKRKIATFMSVSENTLTFPATNQQSLDYTKYGDEFTQADITIIANPKLSINESFKGSLIVDGIEYQPNTTKVTTSNGEFTFNNIDLNKFQTSTIQFVSNQNVSINENVYESEEDLTNDNPSATAIEVEYQLDSNISSFVLTKSGGKYDKVKITSGNKVNVQESLITPSYTSVRQGSLADIGVGGITGNPLGNRLSNSAFRWNETFGRPEDGQLGSHQTQEKLENAIYRLTGTKAIDTVVYAIIFNPELKTRTIEILGQSYFGPDATAGQLNFGSNKFNKMLVLPWYKESTTYKISVYQADPSLIDILNQAKAEIVQDQEKFLLTLIGEHQSDEASVTVTVSNKRAQLDTTPPDWATVSIGSIFPVYDPIDTFLTELIDMFKEVIPAGPYDAIRDWLDLVKEKLQEYISVIEKIRAVINNILSLLQIGDTGFWFLAIADANGVEGFKQRIRNVPVPADLRAAKYVTGVQLLAPDSAGDALIGLFSELPSFGQDNVKVPDDISLRDLLEDEIDKTEEKVQQQQDLINQSRKQIKDITNDDLAEVNWAAREI